MEGGACDEEAEGHGSRERSHSSSATQSITRLVYRQHTAPDVNRPASLHAPPSQSTANLLLIGPFSRSSPDVKAYESFVTSRFVAAPDHRDESASRSPSFDT
jgi:hypothetical protein